MGTVGSERKIVNVAAGTIAAGSTDAINGGQLLTANQRVAQAFGGGAGLDGNGQLTMPTYTIQGTNYNDVGSAFVAVNAQLGASGGSPYFKANSSGPAAQATGTDALAMGSNAQSSGSKIGRHRHQLAGHPVGRHRHGRQCGGHRRERDRDRQRRHRDRLGGDGRQRGGRERRRRLRRQLGGDRRQRGRLRPRRRRRRRRTWSPSARTWSRAPPTPCRSARPAPSGASPTWPPASRRPTPSTWASSTAWRPASSRRSAGLQTQINDNNHEARAGTAIALALGGTANLQPGRRFALSASYGNFQGSNALGLGATALLHDTRSHAVTFNAGFGLSVDTNVVGTRGAVSLQW